MPAPAVRLRAEFSDILGEEWQLNIHDADYAGSIVDFNVGGDAYVLRYEGNNEDRHQPVIGSTLEFSIVENAAGITTFLDYLPSSQDGELTVTLRYDPDGVNTLYWAGVILPEQVVRQDQAYPAEVRIIAADDLGNLAGIEFNDDGVAYDYSSGRTIREYIVKHCLGKLRTVDHWGATDIFASLDSAFTPTNLYGTGDFFSNLIVNTETWLKVEENEISYYSTLEVLQSFCRVFNARLFLANGRFWFIPVTSHHDSATLTYLNYYSDASYTSSSTADVSLTLQTDIIKETGWEYTHQLPLKQVRRTLAYNHQEPIAVYTQEHQRPDFGDTLVDIVDYSFESGTKFRITFDNSVIVYPPPGGNNTLLRANLLVRLRVGTYYHKWEHTYDGTAYYYDFLNAHEPTVYGTPEWTNDSTDRSQLRIRNLNLSTGVPYPSIDPLGQQGLRPFEFITAELPADSNGIEMSVGFEMINPDGTVNSTYSATGTVFVVLKNIKVFVDGNNGDTIDYVATNALNARSILDNGLVLIGDPPTGSMTKGQIFVKTGASTFSVDETWSSTEFGGGHDINALGVKEILRGQKMPLYIERGSIYANDTTKLLHMYNVVLSDSRRMGIYQYTYNGRMRRYDVELFHITGNQDDISVVGKPPKVINPPVAPAPASATPGYLEEISTTKADVATLELDLQDVDSLVTKLYNTFQPVGDDYLSTKITYEESKLDGMNVELTQGQITMASSSGNTLMGLRESSPGTWDLYLQDDATPTPNSVLTMTATAAAGVGYVGINTETPTAPLEVTGAVKITGSITITGTVDGVDVSALKTTVDGLSAGTGDTSNFWAFYLAD
jgi:hypothetical protein